MLHPEITCPYCRMGFGGHFAQADGTAIHLDIMWSYDAGMQVPCTQADILSRGALRPNNSLEFVGEQKEMFDELAAKFSKNPDDVSKENTPLDAYIVGVQFLNKYGEAEDDDEEMRPGVTYADIQSIYESGMSLKDCFKSIMVKNNG